MKQKSLNFNLTDEAIAKYKLAAKVGATTAVAGTAGVMAYLGVKTLKHKASKILAGTAAGIAIGVPFAFSILMEYRAYVLETEHRDIMDDLINWVESLGLCPDDFDDIEDFADDFDDDFFDDEDDIPGGVDDTYESEDCPPVNQEAAEINAKVVAGELPPEAMEIH